MAVHGATASAIIYLQLDKCFSVSKIPNSKAFASLANRVGTQTFLRNASPSVITGYLREALVDRGYSRLVRPPLSLSLAHLCILPYQVSVIPLTVIRRK